MTRALALQQPPQAPRAGQAGGQEFVVAVEQVGHAALGDLHPAPAQGGVDLRHAAVLAVAQHARPGRSRPGRTHAAAAPARPPPPAGKGHGSAGNPAPRSGGSAAAAAPRPTGSPGCGGSRSATACGRRSPGRPAAPGPAPAPAPAVLRADTLAIPRLQEPSKTAPSTHHASQLCRPRKKARQVAFRGMPSTCSPI